MALDAPVVALTPAAAEAALASFVFASFLTAAPSVLLVPGRGALRDLDLQYEQYKILTSPDYHMHCQYSVK